MQDRKLEQALEIYFQGEPDERTEEMRLVFCKRAGWIYPVCAGQRETAFSGVAASSER